MSFHASALVKPLTMLRDQLGGGLAAAALSPGLGARELAERRDVVQVHDVGELVVDHVLVALPSGRSARRTPSPRRGRSGRTGSGRARRAASRAPARRAAARARTPTRRLKSASPSGVRPQAMQPAAGVGEGLDLSLRCPASAFRFAGVASKTTIWCLPSRDRRDHVRRPRRTAGPSRPAACRPGVAGSITTAVSSAYRLVAGAVGQHVVEEPLGHRVGGQLLAHHHLAQQHQPLVDRALGDGRVAELLVAVGQRDRAARGLAVDVAVDDVVARPGEEVRLVQTREDGVLEVLGEGDAADVVGRRRGRRAGPGSAAGAACSSTSTRAPRGGQGQPARVGGVAGAEGILADHDHARAGRDASTVLGGSVKAMPRACRRALTAPCGSSTTSSSFVERRLRAAVRVDDAPPA